MLLRKLLIGVLVAGALAVPAVSQARVDVDINIGPPPAHVEVIPAPRGGYV